ncbi:CoF synthetase [Snodgrassella sp. B3882]|uniref:F390 synthetase-related protein n=1 Tax=Snodgrassella sp. B3882 TaxID=2818037 RepID=UPI002269CE07|nr:F390 synthetase-related protein [Snodgrassella sp. B3882]MCX8745212.1 CoF synthetase [Snodgrassella sp. B3882]
MNTLKVLWHYWKTKRLSFASREELQAYQQQQLTRFRQKILSKSPYFRRFATLEFDQWPLMNKQIMMRHFDAMNTAGLELETLLDCARQSEQSKDFSPKVGQYSVGLSSGTSGSRGLFVVSPKEQQMWAGAMLAKMLPKGLLAHERVALFLRADNHLYHSVDTSWLKLRFFGLFDHFQQQLHALAEYQPTIIIAPAQVLCALARAKQDGNLSISPDLVISAAEVLEYHDRQMLAQVFNRLGEVYQATEGFLGSTCAHGVLHLNEEFILVEPQWLEEKRFVPVITDFTRETQPIVRYRLDDILVRREEPCLCGRQGMAIATIEGRHDDQIILKNQCNESITIFSDYCSRIIANHLPLNSDYRLIQHATDQIELIGCCALSSLQSCQLALQKHFLQQGAQIDQLDWILKSVDTIPVSFMHKKRRIIREK